ncbi:MAG: hypothetical protein WCW56_00555 [Candidatus Paceibacterota bacterium]|jgi:hypothetical protein
MKKHLVVLVVMLFFFGFTAVVFADEAPINSELAAAALVTNPAVSYTGSFWFNRVGVNGYETYVYGDFAMDKNGFIHELVINNQSVDTGPNGLPGLPQNAEGICSKFSLYLRGVNEQGEGTGYGRFDTDLLKDGQSIKVVMYPYSKSKFITFTCPDGINSNNLEVRVDGEGFVGAYDQNNGGFTLWYNPSMNQAYQIVDRTTGLAIAVGHTQDQNVSGTDSSVISVTHAGNVVPLFENDKWQNLVGQQFDGQIDRGAAKVYMADLKGQSAYFAVTDIGNPNIKVNAVEANGSLTQICWWQWSGDYSVNDQNGCWPNVSLPAGYDKVVITITGDYLKGSSGFRFYGNLGSSSKG